MKKIIYPKLNENEITIGVTAPSSGVEPSLKILMDKAKLNVEKLGMNVVFGHTVLTQNKGKSGPASKRVSELHSFLKRDDIDIIMPPWGGSFLMEILPQIDWDFVKKVPPKWIIGYSDISTLLFVYTTITGIATAHGPNFSELSSPIWDETTKRWLSVLKTNNHVKMIQYSSDKYQSSWEFVYKNPAQGFNLDTPTKWKSLNGETSEKMKGRLIGGCLNTLQILIGTPFDQVKSFVTDYCSEGTIFYLEPVGMNAAQIYRALWQMKQNQWFKNCNGILFGRPGLEDLADFTLLDALNEVFLDIDIPVLYDVDIGHMPPQLTLVNGAIAEVELLDNKGMLTMEFN
ncbi:S66 peptidase family protein [Rummeliibacillus sp. POC4]|uniref:S66 family peptidase n=1 Tax=Rummeliibacillus sp. POC4 TaxID=2305899 RepID=UPI000E675A9D|nr:S66 peptidase family protein [Rummeliibacillus sp. POC4]RIJ63253.1 LD-carboxypeptidase [Rummeliibacillus sp. POC4]